MSSLAIITSVIGLATLLGGVAALYAPDTTRRALLGLPRHDVAGWALTAISLFWAGWLLLNTPPFSEFAHIEPLVYAGMPFAFFALVLYLDELLAARALGGFILLLASPILAAARWHPSSLSRLISLLTYFWIVYGIVLIVAPFYLRSLLVSLTRSHTRFRICSLFGAGLGAFLLLLGLFVF